LTPGETTVWPDVGPSSFVSVSVSPVTIGAVESTAASFQDVAEMVFAAVGSTPPTVFVSNNLEHIFRSRQELAQLPHAEVNWVVHLDGMPLVWRARSVLGRSVERVNGTDLLTHSLERAALDGVSVGFLGGTKATHDLLWPKLRVLAPDLVVAGAWTPEAAVFSDQGALEKLAAEVAAASPAILVVSLGKPKQELWAAQWAEATGCGAILLTGGAIDLLAGLEHRAPSLVARMGLEWLWRVAQNPLRLGRRYLKQTPVALWTLMRNSGPN